MKPLFKVERLRKTPKFNIRLNIRQLLKYAFTLSVWFFVIGVIFFLVYFIYLQWTLPDPETLISRKVGESTKIYDRTGEVLLYDIHGEEIRTIIPWEEIPEYVKKATVASEDDNFYYHKGIDFMGIARAFITNLRSGEIAQGGSTITQQLVGNALVGRQRTVDRKLREAILSIEAERRFSKDELLWMYLNQIPYGSNAYGIEAASKTFFGKPAQELTLAEAALLSSLIRGTTYYSPYGNHVDELMIIKDSILKKMFDLSFITEAEYDDAIKQELTFESSTESITAPHFVIMIREYLASKYGEGTIENSGFKIISTLDADLQSLAEESVEKYAEINKEKYKANNAALVVIDPKTGELLALVGSNNYFDIENEGNFNVALAKRQPGSSFKPFAYATAIKKGYPDATIVFDTKTEFNPECSPEANEEKDPSGFNCYSPGNYDGRFRGPVTLRNALAQSLNIPSVKTLYLAGIEDTINVAEAMGITTLQDRSRFGLSLVLGGAEVRLVDLVSAYGVFANDGIKNDWHFIQKIESNNEIIEEHKINSKKVLDSKVTRLITDMLSDNRARSPVFGTSSYLYVPGVDVAAKTGTTQENRDAWLVGYTSSLAVGVWVGNNDNTSMTREGAGVSAAGPMWNEFIRLSSQKISPGTFNRPDLITSDKIMLNGQYQYKESPDSSPEIHTILYYVNRNNPLGFFPLQPDNDSQFKNWEYSVRRYFNLPIETEVIEQEL